MAEQRTRFAGTYEHGLDDKGRMVLPARIRARLGESGMLAKLDDCIGLWTIDGYDEAADELAERVSVGTADMDALRQFTADAYEITPDQQGRIVIPQRLRGYAQLGAEVVVTGVISHVEIWDAERWSSGEERRDAALRTTTTDRPLGIRRPAVP